MSFTPVMNAAISAPDYRIAETKARELLRQVGVDEPPVDPIEIARALNVKVMYADFSGEGDSVSGYYDFATDQIWVNRHDDPRRQIFTVAHELGHRVLHRSWAKSSEYRVLWRDAARQQNDKFEREANAFAANLLMPKAFMDRYYGLGPVRLAQVFAVSLPAMKNRLNFLYGL